VERGETVKQHCKICGHGSRKEIDAGILAGTPYRQLAQAYGVSLASLSRHRNHVAEPSDGGGATDSLANVLDYGILTSRSLVSRARRKGGNVAASLTLRALAQLADLVQLRQRLEARSQATTQTREQCEKADVVLPARTGTGDLIAAIQDIYGIRIGGTQTVVIDAVPEPTHETTEDHGRKLLKP
jgi:hypothetical protein